MWLSTLARSREERRDRVRGDHCEIQSRALPDGLDSKVQKGEATIEVPTSRLALSEHRAWERASALAPRRWFAPGRCVGLMYANTPRPNRVNSRGRTQPQGRVYVMRQPRNIGSNMSLLVPVSSSEASTKY